MQRTKHESVEASNETSALLPEMPPQRRREFAQRRHSSKNRQRRSQSSAVIRQIFDRNSSRSPKREIGRVDKDIALVEASPRSRHQHSTVYVMLNPASKRLFAVIFKRFITIIILTDLVLFILSTDPKLLLQHEDFFHGTEGVASTLFLMEYAARLIVCTEKRTIGQKGPFWGRIHYMCTVPAVIDLLAASPFFLEIPTGWNLPTLTYLRFFRLFRILKTEGFVQALDAVYRVIYYNREILHVAAMLCIFLVLVTSVLLFYLRPSNPDDQEDFQSIGATLFLSIMMLTGQGSPEGPLPWYTKMIVVLTSVFSVAMFAIPASMLTWGFEAEAERMAKRQRVRHLRGKAGQNATSSSSEDLDTTDEEYFKIIAGEDLKGDVQAYPLTRELDGEGRTSEAGSFPNPLESRVERLEDHVHDMHRKLDTILSLLQQRQDAGKV